LAALSKLKEIILESRKKPEDKSSPKIKKRKKAGMAASDLHR